MKPSIGQAKEDPGDLRLRRFTMGMGVVFFFFACGGVELKPGGIPVPWLGTLALTVKSPKLILAVIFLTTLYALCLFLYRKCYLHPMPYQIRRWFLDFGVMVEFVSNKEQIEERSEDRNLHFSILQKGPKSSSSVEKIFNSVPSDYLSEFLIAFHKDYNDQTEAILSQVISRVLKKYFPFITRENLDLLTANSPMVVISGLNSRTKIFGLLEDFIYLLPTVPYLFGLLCLLGSFTCFLWSLTPWGN